MTLRWGILATGGIARAFAKDLHVAGLDLRAVASRSQESADQFAADGRVTDDSTRGFLQGFVNAFAAHVARLRLT